MRKQLIKFGSTFLLTVTFLFSCSNDNDVKPISQSQNTNPSLIVLPEATQIQQAITEFGVMYDKIMIDVMHNSQNWETVKLDGPLSPNQQQTLNPIKAELPSIQLMKSRYIPQSTYGYNPVLREIEIMIRSPRAINPHDLTYFTVGQKDVFNALLQIVRSTTYEKYNIQSEIISFRNSYIVNQPTFTKEQKIEMLAATEALLAMSKYVSNFGTGVFYTDLTASPTGRIAGNCAVNWRGVWAGAVATGLVGAVRGAMVGAAGGTVSFPGLGTATGAVAGGVFGGATGYVAGASSAIIKDLILTCGGKRKLPVYLAPATPSYPET